MEMLKLQIDFPLAPAIWSKSLSKSTLAGTGAGTGRAGRGAVAGAERAGAGSGSLVEDMFHQHPPWHTSHPWNEKL